MNIYCDIKEICLLIMLIYASDIEMQVNINYTDTHTVMSVTLFALKKTLQKFWNSQYIWYMCRNSWKYI